MTEEELFNDIVRLSEKSPKGPQPPYAPVCWPIHPDSPVDYEGVRCEFYESVLGESDMVYHAAVGAPHIDVFRHPPTKSYPFWCYVTNGMSDFPQVLPNNELLRTELMACVSKPTEGLPDYLHIIGQFPFEYETFLGANHTIALAPGLAGEPFTHAILVDPFLVPEARAFQLDGKTVFTICMAAISESERAFAIEHSSGALLDSLPDQLETWLLDGRSSRP